MNACVCVYVCVGEWFFFTNRPVYKDNVKERELYNSFSFKLKTIEIIVNIFIRVHQMIQI